MKRRDSINQESTVDSFELGGDEAEEVSVNLGRTFGQGCAGGCLWVVAIVLANLGLLACGVWVAAKVLQMTGVL